MGDYFNFKDLNKIDSYPEVLTPEDQNIMNAFRSECMNNRPLDTNFVYRRAKTF